MGCWGFLLCFSQEMRGFVTIGGCESELGKMKERRLLQGGIGVVQMKMRALGQSGIDASAVALGTWAIGGWMWGGSDERDSVDAVCKALDAGINLIDTAPIYGFGLSETVVGKALEGRRDEAVLATKCGMVAEAPEGYTPFFRSDANGPDDGGHVRVYLVLRPESVRREIEDSLQRLRTDRLDLVQTHWQDGNTPIEDTMACLMDLKQEGKIRAIGACNASPEELKAYVAAGQLDVNQEKYSMIDRKQDDANLPYCQEKDIAFFAYSPLALGLLTGKIGPEREFEDGDLRKRNPRFARENLERLDTLFAAFRPIAGAHGITIPQLVIAWTLEQPGVTHVLCGSRKPEHVAENAKAGVVALPAEELAAMDAAIAKAKVQ